MKLILVTLVLCWAAVSVHAFDKQADGTFTVERFFIDESSSIYGDRVRMFIYAFPDTAGLDTIVQRGRMSRATNGPLDSLAAYRVEYWYDKAGPFGAGSARTTIVVGELVDGDPTIYSVSVDSADEEKPSFDAGDVTAVFDSGRRYLFDGGLESLKDSGATALEAREAEKAARLAIPAR
mgnify:CR=1 FL=1